MSRFSEKAIEEMNKENEKQFEIDYECVQFGKWILNESIVSIKSNNTWCMIEELKEYTTEELYQLYKNEQINNNKNSNNNNIINHSDDIVY